jgi:hypothetical protein
VPSHSHYTGRSSPGGISIYVSSAADGNEALAMLKKVSLLPRMVGC